jgi:hypothetical protein
VRVRNGFAATGAAFLDTRTVRARTICLILISGDLYIEILVKRVVRSAGLANAKLERFGPSYQDDPGQAAFLQPHLYATPPPPFGKLTRPEGRGPSSARERRREHFFPEWFRRPMIKASGKLSGASRNGRPILSRPFLSGAVVRRPGRAH